MLGIWIKERDQEERNIILPRYPAKARQVNGRKDVPISIRLIRNQKFP